MDRIREKIDEVTKMQISWLEEFLYFLGFLEEYTDESNIEQILGDNVFSNPQYKEVINLISLSCPEDLSKDKVKLFENGSFEEKLNVFRTACDIMLRDLGEDAINHTYAELINDLQDLEPFAYAQVEPLNHILGCHLPKFSNPIIFNEETLLSGPRISIEDLLKLVSDFFDYMDSTGDFSERFFKMLEEKRIVMWNSLEEPPISVIDRFGIPGFEEWSICTYEDGKQYINAPLTGTLKDAFFLSHEVTHSIFRQYDDTEAYFLSEFFPILTEYFLYDYLVQCGYSSEELDKVYVFRAYEERELMISVSKIISLMDKKINGERIIEEDFIQNYTKEELLEKTKGKVSLDEIGDFDKFVEETNSILLDTGSHLLKYQISSLNVDDFIEEYVYIFAKLFSRDLYTQSKDKKVLFAKVRFLISVIANSEMSFCYYLGYLELWNYYFMFNKNFDQYTFPPRIEDKQMIKK